MLKRFFFVQKNQISDFCRTEPVTGCKYVNKGGQRGTKGSGFYTFILQQCVIVVTHKVIQPLYHPCFPFLAFTYRHICIFSLRLIYGAAHLPVGQYSRFNRYSLSALAILRNMITFEEDLIFIDLFIWFFPSGEQNMCWPAGVSGRTHNGPINGRWLNKPMSYLKGCVCWSTGAFCSVFSFYVSSWVCWVQLVSWHWETLMALHDLQLPPSAELGKLPGSQVGEGLLELDSV